MARTDEVFTCFFYGTLMNDAILRRVIGTSSDHLQIADALLKNYTRHHVKGVDYPAVVPARLGEQVMGRALTDDEASVRGCVVKGLTAADLRFLDTFEGDEYERQAVQVEMLSPWRDTADVPKPHTNGQDMTDTVDSDVYIWIDSPKNLESSLWSYEAFLRDKAHMWIGNGHSDAEYLEVDRRRQMEGKIIRNENGYKDKNFPKFGHEMRDKHFSFEKGYINLNHGGRGATPKAVTQAKLKWMEKAEGSPDRFAQQTYYKELPKVREVISTLLHAEPDNVAFVLNATTGVNAVLRSIRWRKGDHILYLSNAIYGACDKTLSFVRSHYGIDLVPVDFTLPQTHEEILRKTRQTIEETQKRLGRDGRIRLGLVDAICSMPGVVLPWEGLCALFKEYGILSLVDAAHLIGHRPVDLKAADPDFWVSNVHKWCFAPRSVSVLYVPERNHHLIESNPISFGYIPSEEPKTVDTPSSFRDSFAFTGTQDFSNILAIPDALQFREECGGEDRIMEYNHELVLEGAALLANAFGTSYMENSEKSLIACMANVELPVEVPQEKQGKFALALVDSLLDGYNISAPCYAYGGKIYVRIAAQIYNENCDYEALAKALKEILKKKEEILHTI